MTPKTYVGIDVSKDKLDAHVGGGAATTWPNTPSGIGGLLATLPPGAHILCEATGGYEAGLLRAAWRIGTAISLANAARVRHFAEASGELAKNDRIDARTIAHFGGTFRPSPLPPPPEGQGALRSASRRRDRLVRQRAAAKVALGKEADAFVRADIRGEIAHLDGRIAALAARIDGIVASSPDLAARRSRMEAVKGVGPACSAAVLAEIPELGALSDKQASSLAGVAPFARDSGKKRGARSIRGGRARLRRALYMPALSASRHNPVLREFYARLVTRGKAHHVAITAVMRKLICLLNRILADPDFKPAH